ncbi:MAG: glutamine-hydrolyzing carbamoyl-phosphate synthase small subunit [Candidatus Peribacteraceae bacterium]|jgi:carbamoyl-phosphate synthase small subunit|nr:glutamine-hydrolyzing carbamoyl-phosphate synthase small subunit [Candidatus Peribacteraceae bacterium]MDP7454812.1 glutamine-hydrolyzing carbamoyl-phosphate synthase small subunit [Candidatus Peribacteraceae bacterium]MDP7646152.1 glutamine-hydrolyzing carbamoyl-phosphate synthase small subunit [Candidatus Peribacteraceae bacterium]
MTKLTLSDGTSYEGQSFGSTCDMDGEVVFNTGMAGYVESLTDPSYRGQILVFTYPLIGNYGVPSAEMNEYGFSKNFESESIHVRGVIVAQQSPDFSHFNAVSSIHNWLEHHNIPGVTGVDTRALTKKLREHGVMLGKIVQGEGEGEGEGKIEDPNLSNLVAEVSCKEVKTYEPSEVKKTIAVYDCGIKNNIIRSFLKRGVKVHRLPWDFDLDGSDLEYDAVFISNGPGDPKMCKETIEQVGKAIEKGTPTFGICLGTQILALAVGGDTFKLKYGHRGVNQPCIEHDDSGNKTDKCIITSQNHGFAVDEKSLPKDWRVWFTNANDGTIEGIKHESGKFLAVQFHPEATPGPEDANYLFDEFISSI